MEAGWFIITGEQSVISWSCDHLSAQLIIIIPVNSVEQNNK